MKKNVLSALVFLFLYCSSSDDSQDATNNNTLVDINSMYFPPNGSNDWQTVTPEQLNWKTSELELLYTDLAQKGTKGFIILYNGRIVVEKYFNGHTSTATWQWNSAGKTLTSSVFGIAQKEGLVNINTKVSNYVGNNWTSVPLAKENIITCKHLLTMTSGTMFLSAYETINANNIGYDVDAGTKWEYSNVYVKLQDVIDSQTTKTFDEYFAEKLKNPIGMDGSWDNGLIYRIYHSNTRSMARFGLLALNKGIWKGTEIVPTNYFEEATNTSQSLNQSYGYLWWLNGKSSYMVPSNPTVYPTQLFSNAPADMYCALGKNDQKIYVIPSKKVVVIRMGESAYNSAAAISNFDNELWGKLKSAFNW